MDLRSSEVGADWYCCRRFLRLRRRKKAKKMRAMRATPPATAPPISAPRWLGDDDEGRGEAGETVWIIIFVVVMRPPLAADVTTDTTELVLMRLVGVVCVAAAPAFLVDDVDVVADVDVEVELVEVDELDDDVDVVPWLPGFPTMAAEATAGPVVLIDATDVPLGNGKKLLELVLSQQTLFTSRL